MATKDTETTPAVKVEKDAQKLAKKAKDARKSKEASELAALETAWPTLKAKMDALAAEGQINFYMLPQQEPALYKTFANKAGVDYLNGKGFTVNAVVGLLDIYWDRSDALVNIEEV